jgi:hypothetical protein
MSTVTWVVTCIPKSPQNGNSTSPCLDVGTTKMVPAMVQSYLIDPSSSSAIDAATTPFDYTVATAFWTLAFTFVVGLYLFSKKIGILLNFIRTV